MMESIYEQEGCAGEGEYRPGPSDSGYAKHDTHHHKHEAHREAHHETHHKTHHEAHHEAHHEEPMNSKEAVRLLLLLGQTALDAGDYESATDAYASILKLEKNEAASYNLGSLYARGLGLRRDFVEGARLFHQAELLGNERAAKLCGKCMYDYLHEGFDGKSPADLYASMAVFVSRVYPEVADQKAEVNRGLFAIAATHLDKGEYAEATEFLRAAAEFGNDEYAQYYLDMLC